MKTRSQAWHVEMWQLDTMRSLSLHPRAEGTAREELQAMALGRKAHAGVSVVIHALWWHRGLSWMQGRKHACWFCNFSAILKITVKIYSKELPAGHGFSFFLEFVYLHSFLVHVSSLCPYEHPCLPGIPVLGDRDRWTLESYDYSRYLISEEPYNICPFVIGFFHLKEYHWG